MLPYRSKALLGSRIEEGFVENPVPARSVGLLENAVNTLAMLREETYPTFSMYSIDSGVFFENQKFKHIAAHAARVDFMPAEPSYNIRLFRINEKYDPDIQFGADMRCM